MDAKKRSVRGRRNIEKGRKLRREFDGPPEVSRNKCGGLQRIRRLELRSHGGFEMFETIVTLRVGTLPLQLVYCCRILRMCACVRARACARVCVRVPHTIDVRDGHALFLERRLNRASFCSIQVNFSQFHMNTLKRYKRFYDIKADTLRKEEYTEVSLQDGGKKMGRKKSIGGFFLCYTQLN